MKKSFVVVSMVRALIVLLAYQHVVHPKAAMIPAGTGRHLAQSAKSIWQMLRAMAMGKLKKAHA